MNSLAKVQKMCDNCKTVLKKEDGDKKHQIDATLYNAKQEEQQYHMCDETCLLQFLQKRAKSKQSSKADLFIIKQDFRR